MYNVTKDCISNKCCSFELSIHQRILKNKNVSCFVLFFQQYEAVFNIDNNKNLKLIVLNA